MWRKFSISISGCKSPTKPNPSTKRNSWLLAKGEPLIPCNGEDCQGSQNPHSYRLDRLRKRLDAGKYNIECENSYQMVDVRRLIDDVNLQPFGKEQEPKPQFTHLQRELEQEREESMKRPSETEFEKEIFISYAWGGESEEFVNNLERTLQEKGIKDFQESCRGGSPKVHHTQQQLM